MAQGRDGFKVRPPTPASISRGSKTATGVLFRLDLASELILKKGPPACWWR